MMITNRATCIVFSVDDLPPKGSNHTHPLYILVVCSGHKVSSVLLDNGSALNSCPLATIVAIGFAPLDFGPYTQTVRAYDNTQREVMDTLTIDLMIGPTIFFILFQDRVRARLSGISFDYPVCPYTFSLVDYFVRGSDIQLHVEEIGVEDSTMDELQHMLHHMQMGAETLGVLAFVTITPPSLDRANLFSLCFSYETTDYGAFRVSVIKIIKEDQTVLALELLLLLFLLLIFDEIAQHDSDQRATPTVGDVKIVDFSTTNQPRELKIGSPLSTDERDNLIHLLRSYLDVFSWSYEDMPGLDPSIDGKVKVCVDFRDLNKTSPKDDFSLPHIDLLVDNTAGYMVIERGIEVDLDKIRAILDMPVPKTKKNVKALGCMLAQLDDSGKEQFIYYLSKRMLKFEMRYVVIKRFYLALYVSQKSIKVSIVANHLVSLPTIESRLVDDDFPDEEFVSMTRLSGCRMYFDEVANHLRDAKLKPYHAYLELLIENFEELKYIHLPRAQNQFVDALATIASIVDIPTNVIVCPFLIETRSVPAYCHLIDETEISSKSSNGHEFISVAIDYFTKWVEVASYAKLTYARVTNFIRSHIIYRYGVPHELISDKRAHFRAKVETLLLKYDIQHHKSFAYKSQTNEAVEATNKNIKRILRKRVETSQD
ncbi:hypothetical protein CK203_114605 [Vitis vinifera]|uniref:Integrase catalytic domain-containing protein n=1 Tax=Vitis vinifera TaxID=29760 RepID=A0A438FE97_VITVI|nr:hypothetical protein CK203_114605 [Vitis vinifera]